MKKSLIILLICFLLVGLVACNGNQSSNTTDNMPILNIGVDDTYAPYTYNDEAGQFHGIDIDLARECCARMGYKPNFVPIVWAEKEWLINSGKIDCVWSCIAITDDVVNNYLFSIPYLTTSHYFVTSSSNQIYTISDIAGKNIAGQNGAHALGIILNNTTYNFNNIYVLPDVPNVMLFLDRSVADIIIIESGAILYRIKNEPDKYRLIQPALEFGYLGVAMKLGNTELKAKIDTALQSMLDDGTVLSIITTWGMQEATIGGIK